MHVHLTKEVFRPEGRNSGGPTNPQQDPHRSPPDIDDRSNEDPSDPHGRGHNHIDHVTQLQTQQPPPPVVEHTHVSNVRNTTKKLNIDKEISTLQRRGQKRRLRNDSSGTSEDEETEDIEKVNQQQLAQPQHRNAVLSPTSSSCHSTTTAARITVSDPRNPSPKTLPSHEETETTTSTSVKDLEHAMSKHLPSNMLNKSNSSPPLASTHHPTDFSTDALLKQQQQRSTIQWIGAHHHLNHLNHQQLQHSQSSGSAPLPASALLRQLYANRESVIRANVHGITSATATSGGRSAPAGSAPSSYYSTDVNQVGPLPTPPGSEGSSTYSEHQFMLSQHQKPSNADTFSSLVSSYSTTGSYSMDYHSAMTPPSSVSPRDKHQQIHGGVPFENPVYSDVLRHQYLGGSGTGVTDSPAQPLPLKPQVYSAMHPSALDAAAAAAYVASSPLDQSQFYHHSTAGAGFHLYHPANKTSSTGSYPDTLKNTTNWYSTS